MQCFNVCMDLKDVMIENVVAIEEELENSYKRIMKILTQGHISSWSLDMLKY